MKLRFAQYSLLIAYLMLGSGNLDSTSVRYWPSRVYIIGQSAISYKFSGGRFGDNLLSYMHAKWMSYISGLALLYRSFPFSEQLSLHCIEQRDSCLSGVRLKKRKYAYSQGPVFKKNVSLRYCKKFPFEPHKILYEVPYFPENLEKEPGDWAAFPVDWRNKEFKAVLKRVIRPRVSLPEIVLPTDRITVAVHIRRGGSFETLNLGFPFKFPDDSYYLEQLKTLDTLFNHRPLYVFIFTDDREPLKILKTFQDYFAKFSHITLDCRHTLTDHNINVLEDFFALTKFDCLIRPDSNFSICAAKISDYLVEIEPQNCKVIGNKSIVTEVNVLIDRELCQKRALTLEQKVGDKAYLQYVN